MLDEMTPEEERQIDELSCGTTLLRGQYYIEKYMVRGGFGITYLARDSLDRNYVIKECFPGALCARVGGEVRAASGEYAEKFASIRKHFLSEARRVARLDHPNIVGVHQVFEENNTAYMAMEVVDGDDLLTIVDETPDRLTPDLVRQCLRDALEAIRYIHDIGILHRDISPDNFLLDGNDHLTLIDFGAAREYAGKKNRALSALLAVKDGYSPHEFYLADVEQSASSDLYSLGATFYHLITGEAPPNSQDRVAALAASQPDPYVPLTDGPWAEEGGHDINVLLSIDRALQILQKDRIGSACQWMDFIESQPEFEPAPAFAGFDQPEDVQPQAEPVAEFGPEAGPESGPVPASPDLSRVISHLVENTNRTVSQGMPGDAAMLAEKVKQERRARRAPPKTDEEPKQLVDIFGNPVVDIEAFMRSEAKAAKKQPREMRQKDATAKDGQDGRKSRSAIVRIVSACLPIRRASA